MFHDKLDSITDARFIGMARTALPYWINRAVAAEKALETPLVRHHSQSVRLVDECELIKLESQLARANARIARLESDVEAMAD